MPRKSQFTSMLFVASIFSCSSAFACPRFQPPKVNFTGISSEEQMAPYLAGFDDYIHEAILQLADCHRVEEIGAPAVARSDIERRQGQEIAQWSSDIERFESDLRAAAAAYLQDLRVKEYPSAAPQEAAATQSRSSTQQSESALPPSQRANDNRCNSLAIADACERAVGRINEKFATCVHETEIELGCWRADSGTTKGMQ